ncbi:MAG: TMEM43 family protein [Eubacteriales bacterium]|nr:TMEM43 family protein [Eubacteriales bacterium]
MSKTVQRIVAALVGVTLLSWGIFSLAVSRKLIEDLDIYTGALKLVQPAVDPVFEVKADSPFIERVVSMYQYYENEKGEIDTDFFSSKRSVPQKKGQTTYENPSFPEDLQNNIFYGDVTIGEQNIHLGEEFLLKFSLENYRDFENEAKINKLAGISNNSKRADFHLVDGEYYTNGEEDAWKVGDIKVFWLVMDPEDFAESYTAAGQLQDNTLIAKDTAFEFLYDQELSAEEIQERFSEENLKSAIILMVIGIVIIVLALIPRKKKVY